MSDNAYRTEKDSMGELQVPADALYGAQTQRAVDNFPVSGQPLPRPMIRALGLIKASAARVNAELDLLDAKIARAIEEAALAVADGTYDAHFPVDVFQTGSGTSSNMNANEVIARLASQALGQTVHPNDHVNMGQSSNDVIPTAIHVAAVTTAREDLLPSLDHLIATLDRRTEELSQVAKTGRTHLMDAMPVTVGQEVSAWAHQIRESRQRLDESLVRVSALAQGGTAVGTGINAHPEFAQRFARVISDQTGHDFRASDNAFAALSSQDPAVELSGQLRTLAVAYMKIANDLRWMNSGPLAGLGEIELPALQPGSSIMPGKVNPVIPESVAMVAAQIMGNDSTIGVAGQSGNFQLNVMLPLIARNLLEGIAIGANAGRLLADRAIQGFRVREDNIGDALGRNPILVTALNAVIGYEKGAAIAKQAYQEGRSIIEVAREATDLSEDELQRLLDPLVLTQGGLPDQG